jgi:predicted RNase H-like nuclease (RuvC/YqgF family)|tara:strand:- start:303 stop:527 length:225 start_codon:yes stop_codon:yes gene_type:complete
MSYTKIEGYPDLVKDETTGAVLSNNNSAYNAVKRRYKSKQLEKKQIQKQEKDINSMREEISELKTMMKTLMEKL